MSLVKLHKYWGNSAKTVIRSTFLLLLISHPLFADEPKPAATKSDPSALQRDFTLACEFSKAVRTLAKSAAFRGDPADLAVRRSQMLQVGIKTQEVKIAMRAIAEADPKDKDSLWEKAASDAGLKNWRCPGIGKL